MNRKVNPRELDRSLPIRNQYGYCVGVVADQITLIGQLNTDTVDIKHVETVLQQVWEAAFDMGRNVARDEYRKTLRDEFAMASLQGMRANSSLAGHLRPDQYASLAHKDADAMLAVREQGGAT